MGAEIELGSFTRGEPAVASNGVHYLVVWEEEADNSLPDVVGALVGLDGAVLRELEMPIAVGPEHDTAPAVASDGTDFLVTWVQGNLGEQIVRGMRVSGDTGEPLDEASLHIDSAFSGTRGGIRCPAVAGHGELYRAFWFAGSFLRTARIAPTGERLAPDPSDLWGPGVSCFAAASDGDGFVAAWSTSRVQLAPFGASITSFPPREIGGTDGVPSVPDVASDGSGYLTVWGEASEVRAGRLDSAGTLLDDESFPIAADGSAFRPQVAGGPEGYLVTWGSGADVLRAVHVGGDGRFGHPFLVHPAATPDTGIGAHDLARGDDGRYLTVYADPVSFGTRIAARVICDDASSAPGGDGGVAADGSPGGPPPNTTCSAAADADGIPAASLGVLALALVGLRRRGRWPGAGGPGWRRARIAATVLLATAGWTSGVAAQGEIGPASGGPPVCDGPTVGAEIELAVAAHGDPAVASHDRGYLVVWQEVGDDTLRDIVGARLDAQGNLLDATPIGIAVGPGDDWNPALASDGFDYLVTWVHGTASPRSIRTARVSGKTGAVLDETPATLETGGRDTHCPVVASNGARYEVFWVRDGIPREAWVEPSGEPVPDSERRHYAAYATCPTAASDGEGFLAAWSDSVMGFSVAGVPVAASGEVPSFPPTLASGDGLHVRPQLAAGDSGYFLAWEGRVDGSPHVAGKRLAPDGSSLDATPLPIAEGPDLRRPGVAGGPGTFLVTWEAAVDWPVAAHLRAAEVGADGTVGEAFTLHGETATDPRIASHSVAHGGDARYLVAYAERQPEGTRIGARLLCLAESDDGGGDGDPPPEFWCAASPGRSGFPMGGLLLVAASSVLARRRARRAR